MHGDSTDFGLTIFGTMGVAIRQITRLRFMSPVNGKTTMEISGSLVVILTTAYGNMIRSPVNGPG
jgi:hypothetical protein